MAVKKKREARKSLYQPGWITLDGGFAARRCVVRDMSSTGAKLTMEDSSALAGRLRLAVFRRAGNGRQGGGGLRRRKPPRPHVLRLTPPKRATPHGHHPPRP